MRNPPMLGWRARGLIGVAVTALSCGILDDEKMPRDANWVCQEACGNQKADCGWENADVRTCTERCQKRFSSYPSACQQSLDDELDCLLDDGPWYCPEARPLGCDVEERAYESCVAQKAPADASAYCGKCLTCFATDSGFVDDFCGRYWDGSVFATTPCRTEFDIMDLRVRTRTAAAIEAMGCAEFADET